MGKKKQRAKQVSKGERNSVNRKLTNAARREYKLSSQRIYNQFAAHLKLKNVMVTIENPNKNETIARIKNIFKFEYPKTLRVRRSLLFLTLKGASNEYINRL